MISFIPVGIKGEPFFTAARGRKEVFEHENGFAAFLHGFYVLMLQKVGLFLAARGHRSTGTADFWFTITKSIKTPSSGLHRFSIF